jgi:hypothetical protein
VEVGIDFVGDPIICQKESEESSDQPENPTVTLPGGAESGELHGDVDEIGGGVSSIGEQREYDKEDEDEFPEKTRGPSMA